MYGSTGDKSKCNHPNHYSSKSDAKEAAEMMGLNDVHKMNCNGKTVYMPGQSHSDIDMGLDMGTDL